MSFGMPRVSPPNMESPRFCPSVSPRRDISSSAWGWSVSVGLEYCGGGRRCREPHESSDVESIRNRHRPSRRRECTVEPGGSVERGWRGRPRAATQQPASWLSVHANFRVSWNGSLLGSRRLDRSTPCSPEFLSLEDRSPRQ